MGFIVYFTNDRTDYYDSNACELHLSSEKKPIRIDCNSKIILDYLIENRNNTKSRNQILAKIDGIDETNNNDNKTSYRNPVDIAISVLRRKLKKYGTCIETVKGVGYKYVGPEIDNGHKSNSISVTNSNFDYSNSFPASLIANGHVINDDKDLCEFILKNKHILILGEGGLGKTTFVKKLSILGSLYSSCFKGIYYVSLAKLSTYETVDFPKGFAEERFGTIDSNYICKDINTNYKFTNDDFADFLSNNHTGEDFYLLLLDGLNELYDCSNSNKTNEILSEIKYLAQHTDICIIITSRNIKNEFLGCIPEFVEASISGTPEENIKKYSGDAKELAKIPMYYCLLQELEKSGEIIRSMTKYSLLYHSWNKLYLKSTEKNKQNKKAAYYCFAPELAQFMVNNRTGLQINGSVAESFFLQSSNEISKTLRAIGENGNYTWDDIITILHNEKIIIREKDDTIRFVHQDWCEFLASLSLVRKFERMLNTWKNPLSEASNMPDFNLNVPTTVNNMFLQSMGIDHDISGRCKGIMIIIDEYFREIQLSHKNANEKEIIFIEALCQLVECIPANTKDDSFLKIKEVMHSVINGIFLAPMLGGARIYSNRTLPLLINIVIKQAEYLRNRSKYKTALKWIDYGKLCLKEDVHESSLAKLLNQEGKVYLYYAQSCFRNESIEEIVNSDNATKAFKKGLKIIEENAKKHNNMSSNLLAFIESTPAPFIIKNKLIKTDYVNAFWTYFDVINGNYSGKELVYSMRQCAALLIKGYVKVDENTNLLSQLFAINREPYNIFEDVKNPDSFYRMCIVASCDDENRPSFAPDCLNSPTYLLAESILEIIRYETQDKYVLFLIGCVELAKGNKETAKTILSNCSDVQAMVITCSEFGNIKSEECIKAYNKIKQSNTDQYGTIDSCHILYPIMETEQLMKHYNIPYTITPTERKRK